MTISRAQMGKQIQNPPNKLSKLSQKRKKGANKARKNKEGVPTK